VTVLGILYTGGMLSFGYALRYHRFTVDALGGAALLTLPVLLTWASDVGGYAVGRLVGRRKLIPSVSPGKTVEGAAGALVVTIAICWLYVTYALRPAAQLALAPWAVVVFGAAISVTAQVGDLAESLLKREAGVKDSSRIIPGHGGILDRLDSLLFVLPVAYLLLMRGLLVPAPR
jgi:phosphatidate cytidylyltransferase